MKGGTPAVSDITQDSTANPRSGTGAGLLSFISYLIEKNEMVSATASALRTGCVKVLSIEDDMSAVDLRTADVDDILRRFRNRWRGEIKDKSLDQYEQRFRQATTMYRKWLNDESDWLPRRSGAPGSQRKSEAAVTGASGQRQTDRRTHKLPVVNDPPAHVGLVTYPIPIRPGVQGRLILPEDLSKKEAERVATFVSALSFDEAPTVPAGAALAT